MSGENLIGGPSTPPARRRKKQRGENTPPPQIGVRFVATMCVIGGFFIALGFYKVTTVFELRDYEIETRRLQELTQQKRDRSRMLEAHLSNLRRAEVMKTVAEDGLEMVVPQPQDIEKVTIPADVQLRWANATNKTQSIEEEEGI